MNRLNILYLHSHDTGRYIQPYGFNVPTPNYQRLAEEGVLFRQAFCASPTCSPSRGALLTGMAPHSNGLMGLAHFGFQLNDYRQHWLHTLREAGYTSVMAGVQHIDKSGGSRIGFDEVYGLDPQYQSQPIEQRAAAFLKNAPQQPFFLDVGFEETHRVYPSPEVDPRYVRPPAPIPDTPETRSDMASFITSAQRLDRQAGVVLRALEESGLADNTLVLCTTDHGLAFPAMKCNLTDHGTGVLLILRGPEPLRGGKVIDTPVSQVDLFPTLCDLLQIERPGWLQGHSLMPLVEGNAQYTRNAVFTEVNFHVSAEPQRAIRTERWKYIRRFGDYPHPVLPNCDDSPSKTLWMENGWRERTIAAEQLYDLMFDPNEANNLAEDPNHAGVKAGLRARLEQWMTETDDPLLRGPLEWPDGFPHLVPDRTSPSELKR